MNLSIHTYCNIENGVVTLNGENLDGFKSNQNDLLKDLYVHLKVDYPKFYKMDNLSKLGILGVELLKSVSTSLAQLGEDDLGIVLQSKYGCLETDINHQARVDEKSPSPAIFVYTLSNIVIGEISIKNKWFGESILFIEEPSKLNNLIRHATGLILNNKAKTCLIGCIDSFQDKHSLKMAIIKTGNDGPALNLENLTDIFDKK